MMSSSRNSDSGTCLSKPITKKDIQIFYKERLDRNSDLD